jgi:hypothetical protein
MKLSMNRFRRASLGAIAILLIGLAADTPPKSHEVGELTFQTPGEWKSVKPRSSMSQLQLVIEQVKGDDAEAVLTLSALRAGGGGVEANVKRWQSQFKDEQGNPAKLESKTVKGKNVEVTRVETAGHYYPPPFFKEPDQPNYRLLGAIVQTGTTGYFFKVIGPEKTVAAARPAFDEMIASIKATEEK